MSTLSHNSLVSYHLFHIISSGMMIFPAVLYEHLGLSVISLSLAQATSQHLFQHDAC